MEISQNPQTASGKQVGVTRRCVRAYKCSISCVDAGEERGNRRVAGMDGDARILERPWGRARGGGHKQRTHNPWRAAACPGDDGTSCKDLARYGRPNAQMVFSERKSLIRQRMLGGLRIQPGRRDKPGDRLADRVLDHLAPGGQSAIRLIARQLRKFAGARRHVLLHEPAHLGIVAVAPAVKEYLDPRICPVPQFGSIDGIAAQGRIVFEVGHYQHCHAWRTKQAREAVVERIDLAFEARRHVMDGGKKALHYVRYSLDCGLVMSGA